MSEGVIKNAILTYSWHMIQLSVVEWCHALRIKAHPFCDIHAKNYFDDEKN